MSQIKTEVYSEKACILMPVYNGQQHLREAIDSILNQTYGDFKFLIINDGSYDESEKIILSYSDSRIQYVKNASNKGLIATLNLGIKIAQAQYLVRMDADDISLPERLEKQIQFMDMNPEIIVSGTQVEYFGKTQIFTKFPTNHEAIAASLIFTPSIIHPSTILRLNSIHKYELIYNNNFYLIEDYELWFRASNYGKLANLNEVLLQYRWDGQNITARNWSTRLERYKLIYQEILSRLNLMNDPKALECHLQLSFNQLEITNLTSVYKHRKKLIAKNSESNLFPQPELIQVLNTAWIRLFYNVVPHGLMKTLWYFILSRKIKSEHLKYLMAYYFKKKSNKKN